MNLNLGLLMDFWPRILLFTAALLSIKAIAVAVVVRLLGYSWKDSSTVALNLAQAGEFGLALIAVALASQIIPTDQASLIILVAIFSMIVSPFLIRHAEIISGKLFPAGSREDKRLQINLSLRDHVIIGGHGRLGTILTDLLAENGIDYVAIDKDIEVVDQHRGFGKNVVYGDSNSVEILNLCHLASAKLVILTFKSFEEGKAAISQIRQSNSTVPMIVRCQNHTHYDELVSLGANHVFPELLESSLLIARHALELLRPGDDSIDDQLRAYVSEMPTYFRKAIIDEE